MKKLFNLFNFTLVLVLALYSQNLNASTTTVTGTVQDPNGQLFYQGTIRAEFVPDSNQRGAVYLDNGTTPFTKVVNGTLSNVGVFSIPVTSNATIQPARSQWLFTVCSKTSAPCVIFQGAVSGGTQDISSQVNANAVAITINGNGAPGYVGVAYSDIEILHPVVGTFYYNSLSGCTRSYNGTIWSCNSGAGYINVVTQCPGVIADGVTDDGPAIQACFNANSGRGFIFPQTVSNNCSYFSNQTLFPVGSGVQIIGQSGSQYLDDITPGHMGGVEICFASGVTGFWLDLATHGVQAWAIRNITIRGQAGFTSLITPTGINVPSDLPGYNHSIATIQRAGGVLSVTITKIAGVEGLTQQVGSTVKISGVVGDTTMNGLCDVATLTNLSAFGGNAAGFTCNQTGADAGPFGAVGTVGVPTTGVDNADGIRICANFGTIDHVGILRFNRHGINADSQSGHGCGQPFSDDTVVRETMTLENGGNGIYCIGVDCNAWLLSGDTTYYNFLWGIEDQSSLGNTHVGNQVSNNGILWATTAVPATKTVNTVSRALVANDSVVTAVLTQADVNLKLGSCVVISGVTDASFNTTAGQCFFITSFTDSTHFQYIQPGALANASSSGGTERMAKFQEVYLSAGVDSGAEKVGTQTGVAQAVIAGDYTEGGQNCKFSPTVFVVGGVAAGCAFSAPQDFRGNYMTPGGDNGLAGSLFATLGVIVNDKDIGGVLNFRSGATTDQSYTLNWLNHLNGIAWTVIGNPSGTVGGTGDLEFRSGNSQTRLILFGKDAAQVGSTEINAEGTGAVKFNRNFAGTNAGTGGVEFWSGGAAPAKVGSVDSTGLATFNGGVIGPFFKSNTTNPAASGESRLAKTDQICWRNNLNNADVCLSLDGSDNILAANLKTTNMTVTGTCTGCSTPISIGTPDWTNTTVNSCTSCTLKTNSLTSTNYNTVGNTIRVTAHGNIVNTSGSTHTYEIHVKLDAVDVCVGLNTGNIISGVTVPWDYSCIFGVATTGVAGTIRWGGYSLMNSTNGPNASTTSTVTIDTTAAHTLTMYAIDSASHASSVINNWEMLTEQVK